MQNNVQNILMFSVAASLGALARYGLGAAVDVVLGGTFPWGIFIVNMVGCFAFGAVWALTDVYQIFSPTVHVILLTGFMGAFTTFSSFIFDSDMLLKNENWLGFAGNVVGQVVIGLIMLYAGIKAMAWIYG